METWSRSGHTDDSVNSNHHCSGDTVKVQQVKKHEHPGWGALLAKWLRCITHEHKVPGLIPTMDFCCMSYILKMPNTSHSNFGALGTPIASVLDVSGTASQFSFMLGHVANRRVIDLT